MRNESPFNPFFLFINKSSIFLTKINSVDQQRYNALGNKIPQQYVNVITFFTHFCCLKAGTEKNRVPNITKFSFFSAIKFLMNECKKKFSKVISQTFNLFSILLKKFPLELNGNNKYKFIFSFFRSRRSQCKNIITIRERTQE